MPQMSPLFWDLLMFLCLTLISILSAKLFFNSQELQLKENQKFNNNKLTDNLFVTWAW